MEKTLQLNDINLIPSLTWNWLKMNKTSLQTTISEKVSSSDFVLNNTNENIKIYKSSNSNDCAKIEELSKNLPQMQTISSQGTSDFFEQNCKNKIAIVSNKINSEPLVLDLSLENEDFFAASQTIVAEENSELTLILNYTSLPKSKGFCGIKTQLWAKPYSKIHLIKVQLLGQEFCHLDDTQFFADDNANIEITQIELGAKDSFVNVTSILDGYNSKFKSQTGYITKENQFLDMNYVSVHKGAKTDTKMVVKGTVADNGKKTYRGTIDFKNGCKEATGDEQEETLLLSPTAVNKSIPVILCDEEEVSGTHGATLGRLGQEELFYFQSRGIEEKEAEKIMTRAKIIGTAQHIPHEQTVAKIKDFIGEL